MSGRIELAGRLRALIALGFSVELFANCSGVSRDPLAGSGGRGGASTQQESGAAGRAPGGSASTSAGSGGAGAGGASAGAGGDGQDDPAGAAGRAVAEAGAAGHAGDSGGNSEGGAAGAGYSGGGGSTAGLASDAGASGEGGAAGSGNSVGTGNESPVSSEQLVYWFSADFGITEAGGAISEWRDRSGRQAHATQDQVDRRPKLETLAGTELPAVVFDGLDDHLALPVLDVSFEAGLTFFGVARATADGACNSMLELSQGSEMQDIGFFRHAAAFTYEVHDDVIHGGSGAFIVGEPRLLDVTHTPERAVTLFLNGVVTGSSAFALPANHVRDQNFIGRSLYPDCQSVAWSGELAELLLYARPLPTEERQAVRRYLDQKWGCCLGDA